MRLFRSSPLSGCLLSEVRGRGLLSEVRARAAGRALTPSRPLSSGVSGYGHDVFGDSAGMVPVVASEASEGLEGLYDHGPTTVGSFSSRGFVVNGISIPGTVLLLRSQSFFFAAPSLEARAAPLNERRAPTDAGGVPLSGAKAGRPPCCRRAADVWILTPQ